MKSLSILMLCLSLAPIASPAPLNLRSKIRRSLGSFKMEGVSGGMQQFRREDGTVDMASLQAAHTRTRAKYEQGIDNARQRQNRVLKRTSFTQTLGDDRLDDLDNDYYAKLSFGTPTQEVPVMFDTGSADLWVAADCTNCASGSLAPNKSTTLTDTGKKFDVHYGLGDVTGTVAQDTVSIGPLTVKNQTFGLGRNVSDNFVSSPVSGVLGLGFQGAATDDSPPFVQNLVDQKSLDSNKFGFYTSRGDGEQGTAEVTFGGVDSNKYTGDIQYTDVVTKPLTFWELQINGLKANDQEINETFLGVPDTGTTLVYLPPDAAKAVWDAIPDSQPDPQDASQFGTDIQVYSYPCESQSSINVALNFDTINQPLAINPIDLMVAPTSNDSSRCIGGIFGWNLTDSGGHPLAVVGNVFLKSWYTVFDFDGPRVGFAQSNHY